MDIINNLNTQENFWSANPNLLIPEVFNKLYKQDKSKNKEQSSKIMFALFLVHHPESPYKNLPIKKREEIITKEYLKDTKFKFTSYKEEIKLIEDLCLTSAKRQLIEWQRTLDEKTEFMRSLKFDEDHWEIKEALMKSNPSLYKELDRIKESLEKEGSEGIVKGNAIESAQEKDLI